MSSANKRYAAALLSSVKEGGDLDQVGADISALLNLLTTSEEFEAFVHHPLIPAEKLDACLDKLFKGKLQTATLNFLHLLVQRERLGDLEGILDSALDSWREAKGILPVSVVSADSLSAEQQSALSSKLGSRTGKTIELTVKEDASLIGGFQLHYYGLVEDYSLASKLETFKRNVLNA